MQKMDLSKETENLKTYMNNQNTVFIPSGMLLVAEEQSVNYSNDINNMSLNQESTSHKNNQSNSL